MKTIRRNVFQSVSVCARGGGEILEPVLCRNILANGKHTVLQCNQAFCWLTVGLWGWLHTTASWIDPPAGEGGGATGEKYILKNRFVLGGGWRRCCVTGSPVHRSDGSENNISGISSGDKKYNKNISVQINTLYSVSTDFVLVNWS